ncbi:ferredoxin family protein (plasmid) [Alicyclobacillus fastidiosus]|uniref:Ferredoxin n=1 Tax=Alicyclobacillus fastidiosus TaxID=392011 RepID=A0ABY6ZS19_9BACL|nr:ferredoxin family protein [Alicyclobacillus fastidiosus]WAH44946.1 ferredoxin family protein [Alicyclobacillus fastidiosus]GMA65598.1 4Fe-4S ferredoxin [Alicyclobacillus fastidiosus]GMA65714.1 4Fe-4S ferredoxin [Alicyclobacillus fastidiosus]
MAYVITSPCIGEKSADCFDVCPVDAIAEGDDQFYIDPNTCIDCGACETACPVSAIFEESFIPDEERSYIRKNREFFK